MFYLKVNQETSNHKICTPEVLFSDYPMQWVFAMNSTYPGYTCMVIIVSNLAGNDVPSKWHSLSQQKKGGTEIIEAL